VLRWLTLPNGPLRARRNVAHHYDLDVAFYRRFLNSGMQYSCAYFERDGQNLENAQLAKKRHIAAKLLIEPGQSVLDIGCGFGGMAIYLARFCWASQGQPISCFVITATSMAVSIASFRSACSNMWALPTICFLEDRAIARRGWDRPHPHHRTGGWAVADQSRGH
jgi:SAM-dependent methyltransferase